MYCIVLYCTLPISLVILSKNALTFLGPSVSIVQSLTILKHLGGEGRGEESRGGGGEEWNKLKRGGLGERR